MEYDPEKTVCRNVYVSSRQRDKTLFPNPYRFDIDLPATIKYVHGVSVRNYKYFPEYLVNANNQTFSVNRDGSSTITVTIAKGDYGLDISTLLTALGNAFTTALGSTFTFSVVSGTQTVRIVLSAGGSVVNYVLIPYNSLLGLLGFTTGLCIHRGTPPSPLPAGYTAYNLTATAGINYTLASDTDLIVRITDLEAVLAPDSAANRATAVLLSTRATKGVVSSCVDTYYELLQVQARLQKLRVSLVNTAGQNYDLDGSDASFVIEFHCYKDRSCVSF